GSAQARRRQREIRRRPPACGRSRCSLSWAFPGCCPALWWAFTSLSRDGKEVDGGDKPGPGLDGTDRPLSDRLTNGRAECKRLLARPNVQTRRRSAPTRPVRRQPCRRISAATAMGFAAIVTAARISAYEIRTATKCGQYGSARFLSS